MSLGKSGVAISEMKKVYGEGDVGFDGGGGKERAMKMGPKKR